jgi:Flp pilus assembly protein TadG
LLEYDLWRFLDESEPTLALWIHDRSRAERKLTMKILRNESGQTLVVAAVFMALLACGFMALALDVGNLFRYKRMAQSAANAAAVAAAEARATGGNITGDANAMATLNILNTGAATPTAVVSLTNPSGGNFTGDYYQAQVTIPVSTFLLGALNGMRTVSVTATAIAGGGIPGNRVAICDNGNFTVSGDSTVTATNNGAYGSIFVSPAAASISVVGGSYVNALSIMAAAPDPSPTTSGWVYNLVNDTVLTGSHVNIAPANMTAGTPLVCDLPAPPVPVWGACAADPGGSWTASPQTFGPATAGGTKCYYNLTIGGNGMSDILNPGIYVINGGKLSFESGAGGFGCTTSMCSNLGGNGVFFYLTNGASLEIDGGANVNLTSGGAKESDGVTSAPSLGSGYDGILFFQDRSDTTAMTLTAGSHTFMNGGIIAPTAPLTVSGGSGETIEGAIDVGGLTVEGGSQISAITDQNAPAVGGYYNPKPTLVQ